MKRVTNVFAHSRRDSQNVLRNYYTFSDHALVYSQSNRRVNGIWKGGGPFFATHSANTIGEVTSGMDYGISDNRVRKPWSVWIGPNVTSPPSFSSETSVKSAADASMAQTLSYGATGWKRARPGNPTVGVANFLYELRQLPTLPLQLFRRLAGFRDAFRKGGSEWLNLQFGWLPFVEDVKGMYKTYRKLDKTLAQLVRDNGNGIHRRRTIEDNVTLSVLQDQTLSVPFSGWLGRKPPSSLMNGVTRTIETQESRSKIWFAGKFRYYVPDIGSSQWTKRATRALFGLNPTPEVLWNALPWSWLIDYFANVGDIMSNMSANAVDNLTADYAFIMRETSTKVVVTSVTNWPGMTQSTNNQPNEYWSLGPGSAQSSYVKSHTAMKSRGVASPYGFGVKYDGLSTYQLGILAALGISRWA